MNRCTVFLCVVWCTSLCRLSQLRSDREEGIPQYELVQRPVAGITALDRSTSPLCTVATPEVQKPHTTRAMMSASQQVSHHTVQPETEAYSLDNLAWRAATNNEEQELANVYGDDEDFLGMDFGQYQQQYMFQHQQQQQHRDELTIV